MLMMGSLELVVVTAERWGDFAKLFDVRDGPGW